MILGWYEGGMRVVEVVVVVGQVQLHTTAQHTDGGGEMRENYEGRGACHTSNKHVCLDKLLFNTNCCQQKCPTILVPNAICCPERMVVQQNKCQFFVENNENAAGSAS